jgi:hypothetical protein
MLPPFSENSTSPADQAWRTEKSPYLGTLGPYRTASENNPFVSKLKDSPRYPGFYNAALSKEDADKAADEYRIESVDPNPNFSNPDDNALARGFLNQYVQSRLIEEDRKIGPSRVSQMVGEPATAGASEKDPNTAYRFPGQDGTKVG